MQPVQRRGVDGVKALPREADVSAEAARTGAPGEGSLSQPVPWSWQLCSVGWEQRLGDRPEGTRQITAVPEVPAVCTSGHARVCVYSRRQKPPRKSWLLKGKDEFWLPAAVNSFVLFL